jgi:hypothetical protein
MHCHKHAIVFSACLLLQACAAWHEQALALPYEIIYSSNYCDMDKNETAAISRATKQQLSAATTALIIQDTAPTTPVISNHSHALLLKISMGRFLTAGYAIKILRAERIEKTLILHIDWIEPPPGMLTAQVVTQPCVYLGLPDAVITRVQAIDTHGRVRIDNSISE